MIKILLKKGHDVKVVAIKKDLDLELLDTFNIPYEIISNSSGKNIIEKGFIFVWTTFKIFLISLKFKPDFFIGRASPMMAINSFVFRKPHIIFEDTETSTFCLNIAKIFSTLIITSYSFKKDLGKKHIRINSCKELFYLHPKYFQPDPDVLTELNLKPSERFIIIRFVAWTAHHDIGQHGIQDRIGLVKSLEKYGRVLISSEGSLPKEFEQYLIRISPEKLHSLLYYATLYVGEGGTTASEAAILGTHAIHISTIAKHCGIFNDLNHFGLLWTTETDNGTIMKAKELLMYPHLKRIGCNKRDILISKKMDGTEIMLWCIENYTDINHFMMKNTVMPNIPHEVQHK